MKNLKKVLALVTMLTMLLSVAVSAGSLYVDVPDDASYTPAVEILNALGIMIGDDQGNFNPGNAVTRAEAAAILVRVQGMDDLANAAGSTAFTDVPADHWAAGYIQYAQQSGMINGYGDGTYGPSDPVTDEQFVKMIVATLGYTPEAEAKGGYPSGYLMVASQNDITKGVSVGVGDGCPRSDVARLVYNALEVEMMGQDGYGDEVSYKPNGKTLLNDFLHVEKIEGVVTETVMTTGTPEDDAYVVLEAFEGKELPEGYEGELLVGDTNAISLLGYAVEAYVGEDEETEEKIIKGITKKSYNSEVVIDESLFYDLVETENADEELTGRVIEYVEKANDTDELEADVFGAKAFFNGRPGADAYEAFLADLDAGNAAFGTLKLINNDRDDAYEYVMFTQATDTDIVTGVDLDNLSIDTEGAVGADIDVEDETTFTMFFKADGSVAELADVKEDDVLTVYENGNLKMIYISDAKVEGKVTEESVLKTYGTKVDKEFVIGGDSYRAAYVNDAFVSVSAGMEGIFYLDADGKIFKADASKLSGNYAFLLVADEISDVNGAAVQMKVLTSEGNWEVLTTASKVNGVDVITNGVDGLFDVEDKEVVQSSVEQVVFQYQLDKNGYVNKIAIPDATNASGKYRAADNRIGSIWFEEETLVYSVPVLEEGAVYEEDDVKLEKVTSIFSETADSYAITAYDVDADTSVPAIVLAVGAEPNILEGTNLLVITKTSTTTDEDNQDMIKIYGYQNGAAVEGAFYGAYDDEGVFAGDCAITAPDDHIVGAGDVVIFSLDSDGVINKLEVLMSKAQAEALIAAGDGSMGNGEAVGEDGEVYEAFGYVYKKDGSRIYLAKDLDATPMVDEEGTDLSISLVGNDFSVYEVNLDKDTYSVSSAGKIKAVTREGADANWVYVRMYDGAIVDVVVFTKAIPEA